MVDVASVFTISRELAWQHLSGENGVAILLLWATVLFAGVVTYIRANPEHLVASRLRPASSCPRTFSPSFGAGRLPVLAVPTDLHAIAGRAAGDFDRRGRQFAYWVLSSLSGCTQSSGRSPPGPLMLVAFTVTMLLAYDLSYYLYHRMQHRIPILWELHKVHHSAES